MMKRLLNRRLIYLEANGWKNLMASIEQIDQYIQYSKALFHTDEDVVVYGDMGKVIKVGREVIGHDSELIHHDHLKVQDFDAADVLAYESIEVESFVKLQEIIMQKLKQFNAQSFRLVTGDFTSFNIFYF